MYLEQDVKDRFFTRKLLGNAHITRLLSYFRLLVAAHDWKDFTRQQMDNFAGGNGLTTFENQEKVVYEMVQRRIKELFLDGLTFLTEEILVAMDEFGKMSMDFIENYQPQKFIPVKLKNLILQKFMSTFEVQLNGNTNEMGAKQTVENYINARTCTIIYDIGWRLYCAATAITPYSQLVSDANDGRLQNLTNATKTYITRASITPSKAEIVTHIMSVFPFFIREFKSARNPVDIMQYLNMKGNEHFSLYKILLVMEVEQLMHYHVVSKCNLISSTILSNHLNTVLDNNISEFLPTEAEIQSMKDSIAQCDRDITIVKTQIATIMKFL